MGGGGKNCREERAIRRQRWGGGGGGLGETGRSKRMRRQIEKHEVGDTAHRRLLFSSPFYPHYTLMYEALLLLIPNTCQEEETLGSNGTHEELPPTARKPGHRFRKSRLGATMSEITFELQARKLDSLNHIKDFAAQNLFRSQTHS